MMDGLARILFLCRKELLMLVKEPASRALIFMPALMQSLLTARQPAQVDLGALFGQPSLSEARPRTSIAEGGLGTPRYDYPPGGIEDSISTALRQAARDDPSGVAHLSADEMSQLAGMPQTPGWALAGPAISSGSNWPLWLRSTMSPGMCGKRPSILRRTPSWATKRAVAAKAAPPSMWSQWL